MKKFIILGIFSLLGNYAFSQEFEFTYKLGVFGDEVRTLMSQTNNETAIGIGESFAVAWKDYTPDLQTKITKQTKQLKGAGAKTRPHLVEYFGSLAAAINDEHASIRALTSYLNVSQKVLDQYPLSKSMLYYKTSRTFFETGALYHSKGYQVFAQNRDYIFEFGEEELPQVEEPEPEPDILEEEGFADDNFDDWNEEENYDDDDWGTNWEDDTTTYNEDPIEEILEEEVLTRPVLGPAITFERLNLELTTSFDTSAVKNSKGSLLIMDHVFIGEKGSFDWSSVGLSSDSVFVDFKGFEFDVTQTHFSAKGANLTYIPMLENPIPGIFEYKPEENKKPERLSYPRFKSLSNKVDVKHLGGPNFYYQGGFSLAGKKILSEGKFKGLSEIRIEDSGGTKFKAKSYRFIFEDSTVTAKLSSIVIYDKYDSIYHPAVKISYGLNNQDLAVMRERGDFRNTPYVASMYDVNFTADLIKWHLPQDSIFVSTISARAEVPLLIQSNEYYDRNVFNEVVGLYDFNPLKLVLVYAKNQNADRFYSDDLAESRKIDSRVLKGAMLDLMRRGYINYNTLTGEVVLTEKAKHKGQAQKGKVDYDNILLYSQIDRGYNGILDLNSQEFHFNGVDKFYLSQILDVSVDPDSNRITMMPNKDIKFNGKLAAGNFDYVGHEFIFRYDSFLVEMNQIDSIQFYVLEENSRGGKRKKVDNSLAGIPKEGLDVKIDSSAAQPTVDTTAFDQTETPEIANQAKTKNSMSSFSGTSGVLYISKPNNKAGKELIPNYPKFKGGGTGSVVYFDRPEILNGAYDKSMYFRLPPFDLDSLSDSDPSAIQFSGTFNSNGWFPDFAEKLHIMSDYSLGFEHSIPPEGYQLFGGNGRLYNRISLDKRGLVGNGKLEFLTTVLESEAFIFYPDSVAGSGFQYEMINEEFKGVVFPQASAATYHMKWLPKKDSMYIQNIGEPFRLYNGEGTLDGSLIVTNKGVKGSGTLLTNNSETLSTNYSLQGESYKARHARFSIKSDNPEKPAFFGDDVRVSFDLPSKKAEINPEVAGDAAIEFPYAQFKTSITRAVWDLENQKVFMSKPENVPIEDSYFYTTRADLDSLVFNATAAEYDMQTLELKVSGIPYIIVADSKITPENGEVLILEDSRIGTLQNTNIILDTLNEFHEVYDATVTVISRNEFEGDGTYRFINSEEDTFAIQLSDFHLEEFVEGRRGKTAKHTVANGTIEEAERLVISPGMFYRGNVKMLAHKPALELDGFVKLDLKSIPDYDTWIEYSSSAEQEQVVFKFDESLTSQGKLLSAGLHFKYQDFSLYSTFCYDKEDEQDEDFFKPSGFLSFKADSNEFVIVNRDKDLGLSYSGKVFGYDEITRNIRFEGPVRFIDNSKTRAIKASAIGLGNMATNELEFTSFMTLNFKVPSSLFDMMGDDFFRVIEELGAPEAIEDRTELLYLMAEIIGNRATKAYEEKSALEYVPLNTMSPNLVRPMVFSNVKFKWSEDQKAFYNDGFIGISNVLRTDLNAQFESFFEIRKTEVGETINLFIKASPDSWYFYSMEEDKLLMYSSNEAFNTLVTTKSNIGKAKIGEFQFGPADMPETLDFISTFRAVYFDIDEPYKLSAPAALDETLEEDTGDELPTEEDDGFGDEEDDDGF
jgi:hypothetical protein